MKRRDLHNDIVLVFAFDAASEIQMYSRAHGSEETSRRKMMFYGEGAIHAAT